MSDKYTYKKISEIKPEYAAKEVKDTSGNILSWDQVLKHYPDYKIAVNEEGRPIDDSTRKTTPAQDYHRLVKITENDPNGPYAVTKWLLGQQVMLPVSAIGAVTVPISATVGGLVGGIGGDVLGHYASDWIFDNPDKEYNLLNSGITITPRQASRLVGGLGGGLLGGYGGYAATEKAVKPYLISRELNRAIKEFDGTVGDSYFTAPDRFYRITSSPEIFGLQEQGINVTTRDLPTMPNQANNFRTLVLNKGLIPGKGELEGYWIYPENIRKGALQKRINEELGIKSNRFNLDENPATFIKTGSAHGNRTQAAWQEPWQGSTVNDHRFPSYILEGHPLQNLIIPYGKRRSYFIDTPIDKVPRGARVGFKTGEMPMEGLNKFRLLPNGKYLYEGPILPDKIITVGNENKILSGIMFDELWQFSDNLKFADAYNQWNRFGYPDIPNNLINDTDKLNMFVKGQLNRHNTFSRGVVVEDYKKQILEQKLGKTLTDDEFLKIAATTPQEGAMDITPFPQYASLYGKVALVRRPFALGKNRNTWFDDASFKVMNNDSRIMGNDITAEWIPVNSKFIDKSQQRELLTPFTMEFIDWIPGTPHMKYKTSLNSNPLFTKGQNYFDKESGKWIINDYKYGGKIDNH